MYERMPLLSGTQTKRVVIAAYQAADHISPATGLAATAVVKVSKNGGARCGDECPG